MDSFTPHDLAGRFFNPSVNKGLYGQFGIPLKQAYIPLALAPNSFYDERIRRLCNAKRYELKELKLPYTLVVPDLGNCRLLMRFRVFSPSIATITVRVQPSDKSLSELSPEQLLRLRNPRSISEVGDLITWSLGLISSSATEQIAPAIPTRLYAGFHFADTATPQDLAGYLETNKRSLVGLLINNPAYVQMRDEIVNRVEQKSEDLNIKSTSERLLVNKQSTIVVSAADGDYAHNRRFQQSLDLAEIGLVFREFLDSVFPEGRHGNSGFLDHTYRVISAWIKQPDAVLNVSYSNRLLWQLLASEFGLVAKVGLIEQQNPWLQDELSESSRQFAPIANRWWESPAFAAKFLPQ